MPLTGDSVHVAAACDERYAMPLAAMLASVGASLSERRRVVAHVLETGLDDQTRLRIESRLPPRLELNWIPIDVGRLHALEGTLRRFDTVSLQSYYRLLLPEVLGSQLHKVIYLDCDLVVNRDVGELWDLDVAGTSLLAVPELIAASRFVSSRAGIRLHRELGLPADLRFFNSGVMVLNLQRWRELRIAQRALVYLRAAGPNLRWHDQEAINAVVAGDWRALDPRWNVTMHAFTETNDAGGHISLINDPFILHYNAAIKPWHHDFRLACSESFFRNLDRTAWAGWRPVPPPHRLLRRWGAWLVRAVRKRSHAFGQQLLKLRRSLRRWSVLWIPLTNLGGGRVPARDQGELRVLIVAEHANPRLSRLVDDYFAMGADRVLIVLERPEAASPGEALPAGRERLHLFTLGILRRTRHELLRHLLHRYGRGHWCLLADLNELLVYPKARAGSLKQLCGHLEASGCDALHCQVVPMAAWDDSALAAWEDESAAVSALRHELAHERVNVLLSDSLDGRTFTAAVWATLAGQQIEQLEFRSRVPLLRYGSTMSIAADLGAVYPAKLAELDGIVLRRASCDRQA